MHAPLALPLIGVCLATPAFAKKVILVDDCNTAFVSNHEGFERKSLRAGDVILVGGNFAAGLAQLTDGDTLIILCHGAGGGTGFFWGGVEYSEFGGAAGQMAVPAGFNARRNVTVKFCCCHSAHDPDGNGPDQPLTTKIVGAMGGAGRGHQAMGFNGFAITPARYTFVGGMQAQQDAARQCLIADPSWQNNPPTNRRNPPPMPNQATAAQAVIDACAGAGGAGVVRITLIDYRPPVDQANLPAPGQGPAGCGCRAAPGCGFGVQETFTGVVPLFPPVPCFGTGGCYPVIGWQGGTPLAFSNERYSISVFGSSGPGDGVLLLGTTVPPSYPIDLATWFGGGAPCYLSHEPLLAIPIMVDALGPCAGLGACSFDLSGVPPSGPYYASFAMIDPGSSLGKPFVTTAALAITVR